MNITTTCYPHQQFRSDFELQILNSLKYLIEITESDFKIPDKFFTKWDIFASHYLAIDAAENGNRELCINYIRNAIEKCQDNTGKPELSIKALDYLTEPVFDMNMLLKILYKDKGVGVGYRFSHEVKEDIKKIQEALKLLKIYDENTYLECISFIDTIYLTGKTEGDYIIAGCSFNMWGMILFYCDDENSVPYYIENIVHECAHHALGIINAQDCIVLNDPDERYEAPFRKDGRPMIGIFHAYFVLNRVCQTLYKMSNIYSGIYEEEIRSRFNMALKKFLDTKKIIDNHAKLTEIGHVIADSISKEMNKIIPSEVK
ncbi:aKG-HExxH-type peptide beta-hydroxylase [Photorhabdus africana]|uniref:aKG-HExxH-type peptide beta-hydroxylase n=1 Tax=Photorhabdus africana TaxID=3097554 RepID=UPI002B40F6C2|nr:HEXXH motif-containing putative peptide modification protein [Photorhabdus sp. CRI-LC]